ncbi:MAG: hypothetical protein RH942_09595 [Kiloniellaceae bacterium]
MRKLNLSLLKLEQIDHAFPLVCSSCPGSDLLTWRRFAEQRIDQHSKNGCGVLVVRNEQACIVGLGAFQLTYDLRHGRVLFADQFCALDVIGEASIARSLEDGIEKIARRHGCAAIHTSIACSVRQSDDGWLSSILYERGHRLEGLYMCKPVTAVA